MMERGERDGYWNDTIEVQCPYCGERVEISLEPDVWGTMVQDCEVCCNPWLVRVTRASDGAAVSVSRADGSE
jgi:Cysteine-rich CPXCG